MKWQKSQSSQGVRQFFILKILRVYLKTPNVTGSEEFLR